MAKNKKISQGLPPLEQVIIDNDCLSYPHCQEILHRLHRLDPDIPQRVREGSSKIDWDVKNNKILHLKKNPGHFLRYCPGASEKYVCCDLQTINFGTHCHLGCTYCFLSGYLKEEYLTLYVNIEDLFLELEQFIKPEGFYRYCTGEFTDSLILDPLTFLTGKLINKFNDFPNAVLEVKTKTTLVEHLFEHPSPGKTIVSFSLNAPTISRQTELFSPDLTSRIEAARKCVEAGYFVGFHFDPLIIHSNYQEGYGQVLKSLSEKIPSEKISWISLGALRFPDPLYQSIHQKYPGANFLYEDFVKGLDGKKRYARGLRQEIYKFMTEEIKSLFEDVFIYFCMDSSDYWEDFLGKKGMNTSELTRQMNEYTQRKIVAPFQNSLSVMNFPRKGVDRENEAQSPKVKEKLHVSS